MGSFWVHSPEVKALCTLIFFSVVLQNLLSEDISQCIRCLAGGKNSNNMTVVRMVFGMLL